MEKDTIDRREAIKEIIRAESYSDVSCELYRKVSDILDILSDLPSAQSTIVRCKDCDKYVKSEKVALRRCSLLNFYPTEDWYCAGALERRK